MDQLYWITSSKNKKVPVFNGFQFKISKRHTNGRSYWKCVRTPGCHVTMVTENEGLISVSGLHTHSKDEIQLERKKIIAEMKKKVLENPTEAILKVKIPRSSSART